MSTPRKRRARKAPAPAPVAEPPKAQTQTPTTTTSELQQLIQALGGLKSPQQLQLVGIRNIGGSVVGIAPFGNEPAFSMHPFRPNDPNSMAIISYQRWQQLRRGGLYGMGLIERYDEILDPTVPRAPVDQPHECHPDHAKNRISDPLAFIESKDEGQLRQAIMEMTSETSLHYILGTVDAKVAELQAQFRAENDPAPSQRAVKELPMRYQMAEKLAEWRLDQLSPNKMNDLPAPRLVSF